MKNFRKLLSEYQAVLWYVIAIILLAIGCIYVPLVRSILACLSLIFIIIASVAGVYYGIEFGIWRNDLHYSRRSYLESSKDYVHFKIYLGDLIAVICGWLLILMSISFGVVVFIFSIKFFEIARDPLALLSLLVMLCMSGFLLEEKN
mgnify:CR=1 FL=1